MALSTDQYGYLIDPLVPITDATGKTVKDGFLRVYIAGSSTPVITYRNYDGTANEKTIELDNSGRCKYPVIVSKSLAYKVVVYDSQHSQETPIITVDKMFAIGASVTVGAGATVVTGLDGFRTKPDGFVDASVIGTDGYVALDHTLVTDDLDTDAKATAVEDDRYVPLLNEDVNAPDSKVTLDRLWQWVLGKIKSLSTTITAFRTGDVIPVDGPSGTAKMSKDDLLRETAQDALAGNVAPAFDATKQNGDDGFAYHRYDYVEYDGKTYLFIKDKTTGEWDSSKVISADVNVGLLLDPNKLTEDGAISITNAYVADDGKMSTRSSFAAWYWAVTAGKRYRVQVCNGNSDANCGRSAFFTAIPTAVGEQGTMILKGSTMGGTLDQNIDIVDYTPTQDGYIVECCYSAGSRKPYTYISDLIPRYLSATKATTSERECIIYGDSPDNGAGNMILKEYEVAEGTQISIKTPNTLWDFTNIPDYQYVFVCGTIADDDTKTDVKKYSTSNMASHLDETISLPSGTKRFYIGARTNIGKSVTFDYILSSNVETAIKNYSVEIQELSNQNSSEEGRIEALEYEVSSLQKEGGMLADNVNFRDNFVISAPITASDLPANVKKATTSSVKAKPFLKHLAGSTWMQGGTITSDGKILEGRYNANGIVINVGDINNFVSSSFSKGVALADAHANFIHVSDVKYDPDDVYPLLYIGGKIDNAGSNFAVVRIVGDLESRATCTLQLIQTITLPSSIGEVADCHKASNGKLYAVRLNKVWELGMFPDFSLGDVTLTDADITDSYEVTGTFNTPAQAGFYDSVANELYMANGSGDNAQINVINLTTKTSRAIPLPNIGETEQLAVHNGVMYVFHILRNYYGVAQESYMSALEFTINS